MAPANYRRGLTWLLVLALFVQAYVIGGHVHFDGRGDAGSVNVAALASVGTDQNQLDGFESDGSGEPRSKLGHLADCKFCRLLHGSSADLGAGLSAASEPVPHAVSLVFGTRTDDLAPQIARAHAQIRAPPQIA